MNNFKELSDKELKDYFNEYELLYNRFLTNNHRYYITHFKKLENKYFKEK